MKQAGTVRLELSQTNECVSQNPPAGSWQLTGVRKNLHLIKGEKAKLEQDWEALGLENFHTSAIHQIPCYACTRQQTQAKCDIFSPLSLLALFHMSDCGMGFFSPLKFQLLIQPYVFQSLQLKHHLSILYQCFRD